MHKPEHSLSAILCNADRMAHHPLNWPYEHWYIQSDERRKSRWRLYHMLKEHREKFGESVPEDKNVESTLWYY